MFSYQHRYHAGNFADIHKHLTLIALLKALQEKPTPFCVLDTHAGEGLYDLATPESQKIGEYQKGIAPLLLAPDLPPLATTLSQVTEQYTQRMQKDIYPGSPAIIAHFLREQDRAICIEGHPEAFSQLKRNFGRHPQMHLHQRDALEAMLALLPFKEKRGLIFIDPSFEVKKEYQTLPQIIQKAYARFTQGIYVLWYPLLAENYHTPLLHHLIAAKLPKLWHCEWLLQPKLHSAKGMIGSGIVIINTPWKMDEKLAHTFKTLDQNIYSKINIGIINHIGWQQTQHIFSGYIN